MHNQLAVGVGAGLAAALLYGSVGYGGPAAVVLFYIASLPLFIAGFGWGWATAGVAALTGAAATVFTLSGLAALIFLLAVGAPAAWLSYLANLSRETAGPAGPVREWYPVGRLVAWCAGIGGSLVLGSVIAFGFSMEAYEQTIREIFSLMMEQQGETEIPGGIDVETVVAFFVRYVPPVSVLVWTGTTLATMYLAARAVQISGRLRRPWPELAAFELPRQLVPALAAVLAASFLPGLAGLLAGAFSAGLVFAYTLLGLAVLHTLTRTAPLRPLLLGFVYFALIVAGWSPYVLNWPGLLLAFLGLGESALGLRARARARGGRRGPPARRGDNDNSQSD